MHAHRLATLAGAFALVASLNACATAPDGPRTPARHLRIVNATSDSMTALAFAPASDPDFHEVAIGAPLQGGLNSPDPRYWAGYCGASGGGLSVASGGGADGVSSGPVPCAGTSAWMSSRSSTRARCSSPVAPPTPPVPPRSSASRRRSRSTTA